ncbi:MAG: transglycosylase SLT domain-containing protein [Burkholderiales bacterium]|nr:transglycosylase SLT domain-containing protein [Burkholderiales bacterium]
MKRLNHALHSLSCFGVCASLSLAVIPAYAQMSNKSEPAQDDALNFTETNLWNRIRGGYAIPNLDNALVTQQTNWYSNRIDYLMRIIQRGSRYLYHVVDALDKRGMPTDLALLPFIESAFNPQAVSTAKASGMWQFMPATGRDFNLRQNIFKDDRRGVLDSTEAALDYLQRLYGIFGDWQLALAAYNWGEGSVQRAIKRQQALGLPTDFDSLSARMPNETKNYVPKLQAVKNIIGNPEQFNMELPKLENAPYFTSVKKERDIDVHLAARLAEIPLSEFKALNPQFNRPVITGRNTTILLPISNAELFSNNLLNWEGPLSHWTTLQVNKTERVESLATRFGFQADQLREVNAIPAKMLVKAGSTLLVPKKEHSSEENIPQHIAEQAQLNLESGKRTKTLKLRASSRDTLASLARRYHVSTSDIKSWNQLKRDQIKAGQSIVLQLPVTNPGKHLAARGNDHAKGRLAKVTGKSAHHVALARTNKHGRTASSKLLASNSKRRKRSA